MFYALLKDVDGRRFYRYFHKWDNAERAMIEDANNIKKIFNAKEVRNLDNFQPDKGIYIREIELLTPELSKFKYAILDTYFEDKE